MGTYFAGLNGVRVLQARFHFFPSDKDPVTVGHILWADDRPDARPTIRPAFTAARHNWPIQIVADLKRIVDDALPEAFHRLQLLRNDSWSFVNVSVSEGANDHVRTINRVVRTNDGGVPVVVVS